MAYINISRTLSKEEYKLQKEKRITNVKPENCYVVVERIRVTSSFLSRWNLDFGNLSFVDNYNYRGNVRQMIDHIKGFYTHENKPCYKDCNYTINIINKLDKLNPYFYIDFEEEHLQS